MPRSELRVRAARPGRPMTRWIWPRETNASTPRRSPTPPPPRPLRVALYGLDSL
jgi:hypothetical protein